jgi:outer membrane protein OmpA-like peptidoglycan-associated protein
MRPLITTILLILGTSWQLFSQPSETMKYLNPWQIKSFAKNSERLGDIYSAIDYYEALYKRKPDDNETAFKLGQLYQQSRNYPMAQEYYSKVYDADKKAYPEALFYRGLMKKMTGDYAGAREDFQQFTKLTKGTIANDYKNKVKNEIKGCDLADKLKEKPLDVFVLHLDTSINKAHVEMSPFPLKGDEIMYASLRENKLVYVDANNDSAKMPVRQIYLAKKSGQKWNFENLFKGPINEEGVNVCNPALSPEGNRLFFNKCYPNWKNKMVCAIYLSEKVNDKWSEPVKLGNGINDSKYTSTQPTVGIDSKTQNEVLYFVSDREGGKGGLDIWYSVYNAKKNEFKLPKNAGSKINTPEDEMTPFYDVETHTMYFSSNGWPSIGGMDIFKTQGELTQFSTPENIGFPINSSVDDIYYVVSKSRDGGFFVSNRKGTVALLNETCCDDIFEYRWADFINVAVTGKIYAIKDSSIYDQLEKQLDVNNYIADIDSVSEKVNLLPNQRVDLYLVQDNHERIFIKSTTTNDNGEYFFNLEPKKNYKIVVDNYGLFNKELSVTTTNVTHSDTLHADAMYINIIPLEPVVIKNIYYEYNKWNLTDSSKTILDNTILKIMMDNPRIVVEISSHTDSVSGEEYNMKLSQKRAESAVNYLIDKGIDKERLVAKGYGKSKPIAPNTNPDGTDNPDGRQKNRRTEFKIIGSLDQYSKIIYEE